MGLMKTSDAIDHVIKPVTRVIDQVGVSLLGVMMLLTAADVILRYIFNAPIRGSIEITGFLLLATIFWSIPYAQVRKQHITIELLVQKLSPGRQLKIDTLALYISMILVVIFIWRSIVYALELHQMNRYTGVLEIPVAPFVLIITSGCILFFIVLLVDLLRNLASGIKNWPQAFLWIIVGVIILFAVYVITKYSRDFPWSPSPMITGLIGLALLFAVFSGYAFSRSSIRAWVSFVVGAMTNLSVSCQIRSIPPRLLLPDP